MSMTNEQQKEYIAALIRERDGYLRIGQTDRAAEVDVELTRAGHKAKPPSKRSAKMTPKGRTEL